MSATIQWQIDWMDTSTQTINGFQQVVLTAGWRCNGSEANTATPPVTFNTSVYGTCTFPEPQSGGSFTPYAQLTQDQVLGWIWANGVDKTTTETAVQTQLNNEINPPVVSPPLPWATQAK